MHWSVIAGVVGGIVVLYLILSVILRFTGGYAPGWQIRCRGCGATRPAAEAGVVRAGIHRGKVSGTFGRCWACRGWRTFVVERVPEAGAQAGAQP
jgi:hypothetical protein